VRNKKDKNDVIEVLGDLTWFVSLLILQANKYKTSKTEQDSILMSNMLQKLCKGIGLNELEIVAIIARADNKLNGTLNKIEKSQIGLGEEE